MALDPLELGSIAAIILVFFLWGPQRIPELARVVARARKEFDSATKELQKVSTGIVDGTSPFVAPTKEAAAAATSVAQQITKPALPSTSASGKTGDQLLIETARQIGIQTNGKTREQIQQEIVAMAQRPGSPAGTDPQNPAKTTNPTP